jgi:anaerobic magnesium-protoporphyrin IX monomethyl ester cyclase
MAKVILIYPALSRENDPTALLMPLSLVYVAYPLRQNGYSVRIIDQRVTPDWGSELARELAKGETICVGVSAMTGLQIEGGILAAKIVREYSPDLPLVWGGVHPSLLPEQTVEDEHVDVVVVGEGEETFLELVRRIEDGGSLGDIRGLCYKEDRKPVLTGHRPHVSLSNIDISLLPYDLLESVGPYLANPLGHLPGAEANAIAFLTSRGCPYRCTYCYNPKFNRGRWRAYEPVEVVEHLKYVKRKFGQKGIFLLDDNFFTNLKRVRRICELILENKIDVRFYNVNCRLDVLGKLDVDFLRLLRRAGVHTLFIGVESASPRVLKAMRKPLNIGDIAEVDWKLKKAEIVPCYSFMVGLPVESVDDMKQTLKLMCKIRDTNPDAGISPQVYLPLPGSKMFDMCVNKGLVAPQRLADWAHFSENYVERLIECGCLGRSSRTFLMKASVIMQVIDTKLNKRSSLSMEFLRRVYSRIVRFRIKHDFYAIMPELRLRDVTPLRVREKKRGS